MCYSEVNMDYIKLLATLLLVTLSYVKAQPQNRKILTLLEEMKLNTVRFSLCLPVKIQEDIFRRHDGEISRPRAQIRLIKTIIISLIHPSL